MVPVKNSPFRIIAALMLVVSLLTLSGLTSTAATLMQSAAANSCCDSGCDDTPAGPCSAPDCPCFSCLTMVMASAPTVLRTSCGEQLTYTSSPNFHISEYIASIEYPPETA